MKKKLNNKTSQNKKPNFSSKKNHKFASKKPDQRVEVDLKAQISKQQVGLQDNLFIFSSVLSVTDFAQKINKSPVEIVKTLFIQKGMNVTINTILTEEQIGELCLEFGYDFQKQEEEVSEENILNYLSIEDDPKDLVARAPVVTIMGHVDHGKTSLLDKIRATNITSLEHGGITQHIGSYQIVHKNQKITFLDTPGHEAFTKMRARGASITDLVVLVIAADDGVKPQTIEALQHAKAAKVKVIVFINKIDKPEAKVDLVKSQLYQHGLHIEELGGEVICIAGSVKTDAGINELLEAILLMAEVMDLQANPNRLAYGTVIEAHLDKGYGPIATLLVQNGTLMKGDFLAINSTTGKVRIMHNDQLVAVDAALPSTPVKVAGLMDVPEAGDKFLALKDEKSAKLLYEKTQEKKWKERIFNILNANSDQLKDGHKLVNIMIKTDVHGSLEAIKASLDKLAVEQIKLRIISASTGSINESDLQLAKVSRAVIFGFNVKPNKIIRDLAKNDKIMIRFHNVIYKLLSEVEQLMLGALDPIEEEVVLGEVVVQKLWKHSKIGTIAGCKVTLGKISRNNLVRIIRDSVVIYQSKINSLKHGKNDIKEALVNTECGLTLENFSDLKENDVIEAFEVQKLVQHEGLSATKNKK